MKRFYCYMLVLLFFTGCSSTRMVDTWINDQYSGYQPKKVLIIGLTDNLTARILFEEELSYELKNRGVDAVESYDVFTPNFTSLKQTEQSIQEEVDRISGEGFDAILISAVKEVDENVSYSGDRYRTDYYWRRFGRYYYLYQDVYLVEGYYTKYKTYHIEASLYNLKEDNDRSLVWVGSYEVVDPNQITSTVKNYVGAIIESLEEKEILPKN